MRETIFAKQANIAPKHPGRAGSQLDSNATVRVFTSEARIWTYLYVAEINSRANCQIGLQTAVWKIIGHHQRQASDQVERQTGHPRIKAKSTAAAAEFTIGLIVGYVHGKADICRVLRKYNQAQYRA